MPGHVMRTGSPGLTDWPRRLRTTDKGQTRIGHDPFSAFIRSVIQWFQPARPLRGLALLGREGPLSWVGF